MVAPLLYRIKVHKKVLTEDSRHFDRTTREKIKKKCKELLTTNPEHAGEPLTRELKGYRKLKIFHDYRVVFRVKKREVVVLILAVGIRRDLAVYESAVKRLQEEE